ncbi:hypothetical protein [Acidithiobacillus ferriphilus]|uniref:hypothetical protein n=1 Tax=Acidithiobacillus ferriphilus TaxID=1689834 RepID=UPI001C064EF2|nr:hypothetical protein [Acidithiobacillus ferriphilus]
MDGQTSVGSKIILASTGFAMGARHPEQLLAQAIEEAHHKLHGQTITAALFLFSPPLSPVLHIRATDINRSGHWRVRRTEEQP